MSFYVKNITERLYSPLVRFGALAVAFLFVFLMTRAGGEVGGQLFDESGKLPGGVAYADAPYDCGSDCGNDCGGCGSDSDSGSGSGSGDCGTSSDSGSDCSSGCDCDSGATG